MVCTVPAPFLQMAKKSATKKPAAKKAAKKTPTELAASLPSTYTPNREMPDLLGPQGRKAVAATVSKLHEAASRRKNKPVHFSTASEIRQSMLPYPHIMMQYATGSYGIHHGGQVNLIGPTGIGKSTLAYTCVGYNLRHCPTLILNGEGRGKMMSPSRMKRCFSTDPDIAQSMLDVTTIELVTSLRAMDSSMMSWIRTMRSNWPMHAPLNVVIDPISKLLSDEEAAGFLDYGDFLSADNKKKFKETGTGSNQSHAKFHHNFARRLQAIQTDYNVIIWIIHHQNVDFDMSGARKMPSYMSNPLLDELKNKKHIGGRATEQNAGLQLIMVPFSDARDENKNLRGQNIRVRVDKNSHGPRNRMFDFELRNEHAAYDKPGYLDPAVHFDGHFAKWLGEQRLFGITLDNNICYSRELGVQGMSLDDMGRFISTDESRIQQLGSSLGIDGYSQVVDKILNAKTPGQEEPDDAETGEE